jgi:hypothetical protein
MIRIICIRSKGPSLCLRVEEMHGSSHGFQRKKIYPREQSLEAISPGQTHRRNLIERWARHREALTRLFILIFFTKRHARNKILCPVLTILVEEREPEWMDRS